MYVHCDDDDNDDDDDDGDDEDEDDEDDDDDCHCYIKNILTNNLFLLFLSTKKEMFCPFQDFQGPQIKFKTFQGLEFFPHFQDFQGP